MASSCIKWLSISISWMYSKYYYQLRSSDPLDIVCYYIKRVITSWKHSRMSLCMKRSNKIWCILLLINLCKIYIALSFFSKHNCFQDFKEKNCFVNRSDSKKVTNCYNGLVELGYPHFTVNHSNDWVALKSSNEKVDQGWHSEEDYGWPFCCAYLHEGQGGCVHGAG